jgi:hypothetical protein
MEIDLTEVAKSYGLHQVPPTVYDPAVVRGNIAGFDRISGWIYYGDFPPEGSEFITYIRNRVAAINGENLSREDLIRFTFAHEAYHAFQVQEDPERVERGIIRLRKEVALEAIDYQLGLNTSRMSLAHDRDPIEREADAHGVQAYKLVKIKF